MDTTVNVDTITTIAMSIDEPILKAIGTILEDTVIYAVVILILLFVGEPRNKKRAKVLLSLAIAAILMLGVKEILAHERPCINIEGCPDGYSFPSGHATIAFTLMTAFLNKKSYSLYCLFALFVGFSRLNMGVHVFWDVAGALPLAMLSYYITNKIWERVE